MSLVAASYVLLHRDGEFLLQLRQGTGYMDGHWACGAAGHVEVGESARDTAIREANEELGIGIMPEDLTPVTAMQRTDGSESAREQRIDFFYTCDKWSGSPEILEPQKCAELRWFSAERLPTPIAPYEKSVLDALRAGTLEPIVFHGF